MIYDAEVPVFCDGCNYRVTVEPKWKYLDYSSKNGYYDCSVDAVVQILKVEHDWIVQGDKHFCSKECAKG